MDLLSEPFRRLQNITLSEPMRNDDLAAFFKSFETRRVVRHSFTSTVHGPGGDSTRSPPWSLAWLGSGARKTEFSSRASLDVRTTVRRSLKSSTDEGNVDPLFGLTVA